MNYRKEEWYPKPLKSTEENIKFLSETQTDVTDVKTDFADNSRDEEFDKPTSNGHVNASFEIEEATDIGRNLCIRFQFVLLIMDRCNCWI